MKKCAVLAFAFVFLTTALSSSLLLVRNPVPAAAAPPAPTGAGAASVGSSSATGAAVYGTAVRGHGAVRSAHAKPAVPRSLAALTISATQVSLSWTAVPGAKSYQVWRSTKTSTSYRKIAAVSSAQYVSRGLRALTRYNYKVRAMAGKVAGGYSRVSSAYTAIPAGLTAVSISTTQINLSWSPVSGATSYQLWRSTDTSASYADIANVSTKSYDNSGLTPGTNYNYKVRAVLGAALTGYSSVKTVKTGYTTPATVPAAPTGVTASQISSTQITVSWNAVATATAYKVYLSTNGGALAYKATVTAPSLSYADSGLAAGTYSYTVSAVAGSAEGPQSAATSTITLAPSSLLPAPTGVTASQTSATQITVGWSAVAGATAYKVYLSANSAAFAYKATVTAPSLSYADSGLFAGTYAYKVSAVAGSAEGPQSSATTTITLAPSSTLPAPGNFSAATYNYQSVQLYYDVVQNAATYRIYYSKVPSSNIADYDHFDFADKDCRVIGLDAGTPYYFRVAAVDSGGQAGTPTGFVAATTSAPPGNPPQPAFYLYSIGTAGSKYEMNFYRGTSPIYYTEMDPTFSFYAGTSSGNMTLVSTADLSQYFYFDLTPGQSLWYGFTANWGPYASTTQTIHVAALGQPTGVAANGMTGDHLVHMSWNAVPYASKYNIYYCVLPPAPTMSWFDFKASAGASLHYVGPASGTTATVSGLPDYAMYYFIVVPTDASGVEGWYCGYQLTTIFW